MKKYGLKVAQTEKSVNSPNLLDLNINSNYPFLKAFKQGTASVNVTTNGTFTVDVTHGLGYYPIYIYYVAPDPNHPDRKFFGSSGGTGPGGNFGINSYIDTNVLRLGWQDNISGGLAPFPYAMTFYYYIFYDGIE